MLTRRRVHRNHPPATALIAILLAVAALAMAQPAEWKWIASARGAEVSPSCDAGSVPLSVPEGIIAAPGQSVDIPIELADVTGRGVLSADMVIAFDPAVLQPTSIAGGTLTSGPGCVVTPNLLVTGQITISVFCSDEMVGAGSLALMSFQVVGPGGSSTPIAITSAQLNEGNPAACPDGGSLNVCGADTDCDGVDDDCDGTPDDDYPSTVTTCGEAACQGSGVLTCVGGVVQDSCVTPVALVISDNLVASPAQSLVVPIAASDVTGSGVLSADLVIAFDPAVVQAASVAAGTLTSGPDCLVTPNLTVPGQVTISIFCSTFMTGSGSLAAITFNAAGSGGVSTSLAFASAQLNEGSPSVCPDGGSLGICGPSGSDNDCDALDDDCDGTADEEYASVPTTCGIGSCASTGSTTCVGGVEGDTCVTSDATLSLPSGSSTVLGETIAVPVQATDLTGLSVISSDLDISYDPAVLQAQLVSAGTLTGDCTLTTNLAISGRVRISIFCTEPLAGSGSLADITFHVIGGFGSASTLGFNTALLNEGVPPACAADGSWSVCGTQASETCDGLDNDCDGTVDDGYSVGASCVVTPGTCPLPAHMVCMPDGLSSACVNDTLLDVEHDVPATTAVVKWQSIPGASLYDVVRGDILLLNSTGGNFTGATELCVANDLAATSVADPDLPLPREGFWYLMRAAQCTGGSTYDEGSLSQVGLRDGEIELSGQQCP